MVCRVASMARSSSGNVRASAARKPALTLLHLFSMGLRSGEQGRQEAHLGPGSFDERERLGAFVRGQVVHDHRVAAPQAGHEEVAHVLAKDQRVGRTLNGHALRLAPARVTLDVLAHNEAGAKFWAAAGFQRYSVCLERFNTPAHIA